MKPRAKGSMAELELKKLLEKYGWKVEKVKAGGKFAKSIDFFGLFDLIAIRGTYRKWIQVKCNRKPPFEVYKTFALEHGNEYDSFEVWVRKDNKSVKERWLPYVVWSGEEMNGEVIGRHKPVEKWGDLIE